MVGHKQFKTKKGTGSQTMHADIVACMLKGGGGRMVMKTRGIETRKICMVQKKWGSEWIQRKELGEQQKEDRQYREWLCV